MKQTNRGLTFWQGEHNAVQHLYPFVWSEHFRGAAVFCATDIRLDWETYNIDKDDRKLVDVVLAFGDPFPLKDADVGKKMKRLFERNLRTTLGSDGTSCTTAAQVYSGRNLHALMQSFFKINFIVFRRTTTIKRKIVQRKSSSPSTSGLTWGNSPIILSASLHNK